MAEGPYLIGIDGGTEGVRVEIFDREGTPVVFSGKEYAVKHPAAEAIEVSTGGGGIKVAVMP